MNSSSAEGATHLMLGVLIGLAAIGGLKTVVDIIRAIVKFLRKTPIKYEEEVRSETQYYSTLIVAMVVVWGLGVLMYANDPKLSSGTFGDSFGVLTSLFTGLGFAGIYSTLRFQAKSLTYQNARANSQDAQRKRMQTSETFYRLLRLRNDTIDRTQMTVPPSALAGTIGGIGTVAQGYEALGYLFNELVGKLKPDRGNGPISPDDIRQICRLFFADHASTLSRALSATQVVIDHLDQLSDKTDDLIKHFLGFLDRRETALLALYFNSIDAQDQVMQRIATIFGSFPVKDYAESPPKAAMHGIDVLDLPLFRTKQ